MIASVPDLCILFTYNILTLSSIYTLRLENNRFSLCPDSYFVQGQFRNRIAPGRTSYFARHLRRTISELYRFLLYAEHIYCKVEVGGTSRLNPADGLDAMKMVQIL